MEKEKGGAFILRLYFAVVAAVTLFSLMFGAIDLLTIGLKTYVFTAADVPEYIESCAFSKRYPPVPEGEAALTEAEEDELCEERREEEIENYLRTKASKAVRNIALIIVSFPLFLMHFRILMKDWRDSRKTNKKT